VPYFPGLSPSPIFSLTWYTQIDLFFAELLCDVNVEVGSSSTAIFGCELNIILLDTSYSCVGSRYSSYADLNSRFITLPCVRCDV
jgi:hypothetical protein